MTRSIRFSLAAAAMLLLSMVLATSAFATATKTSKCTGCHTGPTTAVTLSAIQTSVVGTNANYTITVGNPYGKTGWGVFNGSTKLAGNALASSTFTVPVGATYTVYGVSGNSNGTEAYNQLTISPVAGPAAPAAPVLNATYNTSTGSVTISWAAVSGATSYDYQIGTGAVTSTTGTSVTLSGLAVGTTAFKLRATNAGGSSAYSSASIVYAPPAPAAPVLSPTYNTATGSVTISWAAVSGATSYDYQIGTGAVTSTTGTSVTLSALAVGTTAFKLRAVNAGGVSAYSSANIVYTIPVVAPSAPVLNATYNTSTNSVTISWAAVANAASYGYQVGTGPVTTTTATSVTVTGLAVGTTAFKLRATNSAGSSAYTNASIVYTLPVVAPASPAINPTYNTTNGSATISWAAVSGASSYGYQVGSGAIVTTTATSVTLTGLPIGTTAFKVRATNAVGSSAYANASLVYTPPAPAAPSLSPTYNTTNGSVAITWSPVAGATGYEYQIGSGAVVALTGTSVTVSGLSAGTTAFQVRAVNAGGPSAYANASLVNTPPAVTPSAPVLDPVYAAPTGVVTITWPAVPGATSYEYYLAGGLAMTSDTNSVHLAGLVYGTSTLFVRAVNSAGCSQYAVASVVAPSPPGFALFQVKTAPRRVVKFKGRVDGIAGSTRARVAVYVRLASGKYRKYTYTVATSSAGAFSLRVKLPRGGRAYAIATAYGMSAKCKAFVIRK
jgi:hypothetical protein